MTILLSSMTPRDPGSPGPRALLWGLTQRLVMPLVPSPMYKLRRAILNTFGASLDPQARVRGGVRISHPWNLTIGRKSSIGEGAHVYNPAPLTIGARSVVSQFCEIRCVAHDEHDRTKPQHPAPITIGDDVWIAAECVVEGDTPIPNGLLVGARSHIAPESELTRWTIATGHPARSRRERDYNGPKS